MKRKIKLQVRRWGMALLLAPALGLCLNTTWEVPGNRSVAFAAATAPFDALQFNFDAQHSGSNSRETVITPANAGSLRRLYQVRLPAVADGVPALLTAVSTPTGTRDLLFVT